MTGQKQVHMNAFSPGEDADFGDPESINLFLGGIFGRPGRAYAGKMFFPDLLFLFPICFPPIRFPREKTHSYK